MIFSLCNSVGMIVQNKKKEYLVLYKKVRPEGLAMPAGHINQWEAHGDAARRELYEETGLIAQDIRQVYSQVIGTHIPCSRGVKLHFWAVYQILSYKGTPELREPDKHRFLRFMPVAEIREFVERGDCDPAWSERIWQEAGVL